jgi:hypothetical protein
MKLAERMNGLRDSNLNVNLNLNLNLGPLGDLH